MLLCAWTRSLRVGANSRLSVFRFLFKSEFLFRYGEICVFCVSVSSHISVCGLHVTIRYILLFMLCMAAYIIFFSFFSVLFSSSIFALLVYFSLWLIKFVRCCTYGVESVIVDIVEWCVSIDSGPIDSKQIIGLVIDVVFSLIALAFRR